MFVRTLYGIKKVRYFILHLLSLNEKSPSMTLNIVYLKSVGIPFRPHPMMHPIFY